MHQHFDSTLSKVSLLNPNLNDSLYEGVSKYVSFFYVKEHLLADVENGPTLTSIGTVECLEKKNKNLIKTGKIYI